MNTVLSPLVSEFETEEQEASYVAWLKVKVQTSLDDPRPVFRKPYICGSPRQRS
jgi:hypothetical protein